MPDWFAVFTKPRAELQAEYHLTLAGCETFLPRARYPMRGRPRTVANMIGPLFPRYLFARGTEPSIMHYSIGVSDIVRAGIEPIMVPEAVVNRIKDKLDAHGVLIQDAAPAPLQLGDRVEVTQGPLLGLITHITGIDNSSEIKIWCALFGGANVKVPRSAVARSTDPECGRITKPQLSATFAA